MERFVLLLLAASACAKVDTGSEDDGPSVFIDARDLDGKGRVDGPSVVDGPAGVDAAVDAATVDAPPGGTVCASYSDCTSPSFPVCSLQTRRCIAGYSACVNDDATENADDGYAGAIAFSPLTTTPQSKSGLLCSEPAGAELDVYRVAVPSDRLSVRLAWSLGTEQFKASVRRDNGSSATYIDQTATQSSPVTLALTGLNSGDYLISVWRVSPANSTLTSPYSVTVWQP